MNLLQAMVSAADAAAEGYVTRQHLEAAFMAALNWIESEYGEIWLAIGPLKVGFVAGNRGYGNRQFEWALWGIALDFVETEAEARAALMSAAQEQIRQWFKEQGE